MSGHSKWSSIKHKKAAVDAKRGAVFSKLARVITVAAKAGGGNPEINFTLQSAIDKAKQYNMPADNIERAIKRGTGEGSDAANYEVVIYEGYGPNGIAIMVETMTDNRNRTAADVRHTFNKLGGSLGTTGCVAWMFERKGVILVPQEGAPDEDDLLGIALEAGAEDLRAEGDAWEILTEPAAFPAVREALTEAGVNVSSAELTMQPQNTTALDAGDARKALRLVDALEEHDDVQEVYSNFDISDEIMDEIADTV